MVLVKNWPFSHSFFLGNIEQENVFYDILERKNTFLAYKNNKFKTSKNWYFSEGVNPWFWSKIGHFPIVFVLGNIRQENVFYDILEKKNAFLRYKNKVKNPWFWSKIGHFPIVFFTQYWAGKCVYDILERKNTFLGYKNNKFKTSKNWYFSKGVNPWFWSKIDLFPMFFFLAI